MPRPPRIDVGGYAYHVLNRGNARSMIFRTEKDFMAFERVLGEALERSAGSVKLLAYCIMGNHWHLVLQTRPGADGALGEFMKWLTTTHAGRYRVAHRNVGCGSLYQGRYKSFLIERSGHLLTACRYVERNAARAGLVERAEDWRWSSLHRWKFGSSQKDAETDEPDLALSRWPIPGGRPKQWLRMVNAPLKARELEAVRTCANRCRPYGSDRWCNRVIKKFALESTMRGIGRPRKAE